MEKKLLFVFLMISFCANAGELKFPVSEIPEELKKDVNAVIREDKMVYRILSQSKASVYAYYAVTIFNERAKDYAARQVDYDKLTKVTSFSGSVYDATGNLIKKLKNNEIIDHSAYDGGLYNDNRLKSADLSQGTYPYTVVFEYEKEYKFLYMCLFFLQYNLFSLLCYHLIIKLPKINIFILNKETTAYGQHS